MLPSPLEEMLEIPPPEDKPVPGDPIPEERRGGVVREGRGRTGRRPLAWRPDRFLDPVGGAEECDSGTLFPSWVDDKTRLFELRSKNVRITITP